MDEHSIQAGDWGVEIQRSEYDPYINFNYFLSCLFGSHQFCTGPSSLSSGKEEERKGEGVLITELEGMYSLSSTVHNSHTCKIFVVSD